MKMRRPLALLIAAGAALTLTLAACSDGGDSEPPPEESGAASAEEAVTDLVDRLANGEFSEAAPLAVPGQAALASLAEGATIEDVAAGLRDGDSLIAINFWTGFAQSVEPWLTEGVEVVGTSEATTDGVDFEVVEIQSTSQPTRQVIARDVDGYRVDILATFGPSLASRLYPQVERLFASADPDSGFVLEELRAQIPSLHQAALAPGLAPNVVQDLLQLIELITRAD